MFKRQSFKKLGKKASHRNSMITNMLRSIFDSGYVTTTTPKAKMLKGEVESFVKRVKTQDKGHNLYKEMESVLGNRKLVENVLEYLGRETGVVRILKVGYRPGDNAQKSKVELVKYKKEVVKAKVTKKEADTKDTKGDSKVEAKPAKRGLGNLLSGNKTVSKIANVKKERSRARSGI